MTNIPVKKRYIEIDALKGFAIFLVILGHCVITGPINLHENVYCKALVDFVTTVHVPLFFIVSGFCFSYKNGYKDFIIKKVSRILVPYIVFNVVYILLVQLLPQFINGQTTLKRAIYGTLLFGDNTCWFLYAMFIIFLVYPLIYKYLLKSRAMIVITTAVLLVLAIIRPKIAIFNLYDCIYYLFFFHIGVLLKMSKINFFDIKLNIKHILVFVVSSIVWVVLSFAPFRLWVLIPAALVGSIVCFYLTRFNFFNKFFAPFGEFSLQLYLLNGYTLVVSRTIICRITDLPSVIVLFNLAIDFFLSYIIIKYVCKKIPVVNTLMGM